LKSSVAQLVKNSKHYMEPEGSPPRPQEPVICRFRNRSIQPTTSQPISLRSILILSSIYA